MKETTGTYNQIAPKLVCLQEQKHTTRTPSMPLTFTTIVVVLLACLSTSAAMNRPLTITQVAGNVYEFKYILTTGSGQYDQIGVHRVVQVDGNGNPIVSNNAVFMAHGDVWGFDAAFQDPRYPDTSIAYYLANNSVDVWGIDFAWALLPADVTDFTFMQHWGMQHDINDLETALTFARQTRVETGSDGGRMTLLAWSRGGWMGYGLLDEESQEACDQRQVKAYIPAETFYKTNNSVEKQSSCSAENTDRYYIGHGVYDINQEFVQQVGQYAIDDPSGHHWYPYWTNLQYSIGFGKTPQLLGFHYVGGPVASNIFLFGSLSFTSVDRWNQLETEAVNFEPWQMWADSDSVSCDNDPDLTFDKHLGDITVPVFYVGVAGGFGRYGLYTLSLLGSTDVTQDIVSFLPQDQSISDFGHVDLFTSPQAQDAAWAPTLEWLNTHQVDNSCSK